MAGAVGGHAGSAPSGSSWQHQQLLGGSPPSAGLLSNDKAAKRFYDRVRFDDSLDPEEFTVGFVESEQQPERKSGAEAWSMRVHDRVVELPFVEFTARFGGAGSSTGRGPPFHRVAFFKRRGARVWESEYHRKRFGWAGGGGGDDSDGDNGGDDASTTGDSSSVAGGSDAADDVDDALLLLGHHPGLLAEGDDGWGQAAEPSADRPPPELPEECWTAILSQLGTRELCMMARVNRWLRALSGTGTVWTQCHKRLFGEQPHHDWTAATTRRMCRRSALRAARWLEASPVAAAVGGLGAVSVRCLALDDTKAVTGDGAALRVWSHATGRRIATLQGHTGRVQAVAFDDERVVSGCAAGAVRVWGMDDLKCARVLRGHYGPVTSVALLPGAGGIPVSAGTDGAILIWDTGTATPIMRLYTGAPVSALHVQPDPGGYLLAGVPGGVQVWDVGTAQLLHTLAPDEACRAGQPTPAGSDGFGGHDPEDLMVGWEEPPAALPAFSAVASCGHLLAGATAETVVLWDVRCQGLVGRLDAPSAWSSITPAPVTTTPTLPPRASNPAGSSPPAMGSSVGDRAGGPLGRVGREGGSSLDTMGLIAAAVPTPPPTGPPHWACTGGLHLDDWKLAVGLAESQGRHGVIAVHDIRAAAVPGVGSGGSGAAWHRPAMTLHAPGRVLCFRVHEQLLLAGLEGRECMLWSMKSPGSAAAAGVARSPGGVGGEGDGPGDVGGTPPQRRRNGAASNAPRAPPKRQTRYPKRNGK